jgi:tRNA G46 methylase TrmB
MIEQLRQRFVSSSATAPTTTQEESSLSGSKNSNDLPSSGGEGQIKPHKLGLGLENLVNLVIVDVGCGRGDLTLNIAALIPSSVVIGVDLFAPSLEVGRERAKEAGLSNVHFYEATVQVSAWLLVLSQCC